jgi:hypothetical protein
MRTKILGPALSLVTLSNFSSPFSLSRSYVALETVTPPPSAVLVPNPGAHHRLIPGPGPHHHLNPSLGVCSCHPLPEAIPAPPSSTSTPPPSERVATVNLDPTSLRAHHHHPLPQALDMVYSEGDTPPLPHVTVCANVSEFD